MAVVKKRSEEEEDGRGEGGERRREEQEGREHAIINLHCGVKLANVCCCMYTTHCDTVQQTPAPFKIHMHAYQAAINTNSDL